MGPLETFNSSETYVLFALTLMLRPSDVAPNAQISSADHVKQICFKSNQVEFRDNEAKFTFF